MGARQESRFDRDRANFLCRSAIDAMPAREDLVAQLVILDVTEQRVELLRRIGEVGEQLVGERFLRSLDRFDAGVLVLLIERFGDSSFGELLHADLEALRKRRLLPGHLRTALGLAEQFFLARDQLANSLLRDTERLDDIVFRDLERAAFHHDDGIVRAGDDELHVAVLELLEGRV